MRYNAAVENGDAHAERARTDADDGADGADGADGHDADDDDAAAANAPLWLRGPMEDVAEDDADDDAPVERVVGQGQTDRLRDGLPER